jgi:hypothetical protein
MPVIQAGTEAGKFPLLSARRRPPYANVLRRLQQRLSHISPAAPTALMNADRPRTQSPLASAHVVIAAVERHPCESHYSNRWSSKYFLKINRTHIQTTVLHTSGACKYKPPTFWSYDALHYLAVLYISKTKGLNTFILQRFRHTFNKNSHYEEVLGEIPRCIMMTKSLWPKLNSFGIWRRVGEGGKLSVPIFRTHDLDCTDPEYLGNKILRNVSNWEFE